MEGSRIVDNMTASWAGEHMSNARLPFHRSSFLSQVYIMLWLSPCIVRTQIRWNCVFSFLTKYKGGHCELDMWSVEGPKVAKTEG